MSGKAEAERVGDPLAVKEPEVRPNLEPPGRLDEDRSLPEGEVARHIGKRHPPARPRLGHWLEVGQPHHDDASPHGPAVRGERAVRARHELHPPRAPADPHAPAEPELETAGFGDGGGPAGGRRTAHGGGILRYNNRVVSNWPPEYNDRYLPPPGSRYWFKERECQDPEAMDREILGKIRAVVAWAWERAPFYRKKWKAAGLEPGDIKRLDDFVSEFLRFARPPKPQKAREDLNEILSGLLDFVAPEMAAAGVEVRRELSAGLPPVMGDEGQLRAAFLNLLRNAREAMPGGGAVTVRTGPAGDGVEGEVRETGAGIPEEVLPRIFDPFYSTKERGTGLGLAFALQVAEEHGGSLRCETRPGRGTAFFLALPAVGETAAAPRREVAGA